MIRCGCARARFEGKMICGRRAKRSLCVVAALTSLRLVYRSVRARFFVYTSLGLQLSREPVSDDRARWSIHSLFPHIQHPDPPPPPLHTHADRYGQVLAASPGCLRDRLLLCLLDVWLADDRRLPTLNHSDPLSVRNSCI